MVVGDTFGNLRYYKNTGTAIAPVFSLQNGAANPFNGVDIGSKSAPSFADLDSDGDLDAIVGNRRHPAHFEKTGSATTPAFTERTGAANPFNGADVGVPARPVSPISTATAISTSSPGGTTALCAISRTPARASCRW